MNKKGSKNFGELLIVLGDVCIPNRAAKIPDKFDKLLKASNQVKQVLCTGNLCTRTMEQTLESLSPIFHSVRGDLDDKKEFPEAPLEKKIRAGAFDIALIHGHQVVPWGDVQSLANYKRKLGVDILISGHTHKASVTELSDGLLLNPGSLTGSFNAVETKTTPSFMAVSIKDGVCQIYLYELKEKKVVVSTHLYEKKKKK
mmetsp:Transcript_4813/g.6367  ORF Transcript_4813/g.6367 Transcript_4813/m.6367 type:complete len:200 (+) Transcript_4813:133-732(+)